MLTQIKIYNYSSNDYESNTDSEIKKMKNSFIVSGTYVRNTIRDEIRSRLRILRSIFNRPVNNRIIWFDSF